MVRGKGGKGEGEGEGEGIADSTRLPLTPRHENTLIQFPNESESTWK